jgi:hypothetical protein
MPTRTRCRRPSCSRSGRGWVVRKHDGALSLEAMKWGIPRHMKGKSGKPTVSYVTNVRNLDSPFWKSTIASRTTAVSCP